MADLENEFRVVARLLVANEQSVDAMAQVLLADRNAVRLAFIDELRDAVEERTHDNMPLLAALIDASDELRSKYSKGGG